jgi:glycogen synthase
MIAPIYGTLTIAHNTGGLKDTVSHLSADGTSGNGFVFDFFDATGLRWAIDEAIRFHRRPAAERQTIIRRVITESVARFNHAATAQHYFDIYEDMLHRPLIVTESETAPPIPPPPPLKPPPTARAKSARAPRPKPVASARSKTAT